MSLNPKLHLYHHNGETLLYTFSIIQDTNLFDEPARKTIVHEAPRGKGCVLVDGGEESWDLFIRGIFRANDYESLVVQFEELKTIIQPHTPYYLKFAKTSSTDYSFKVKRIDRIQFRQERRDKFYRLANYEVTFKANSW